LAQAFLPKVIASNEVLKDPMRVEPVRPQPAGSKTLFARDRFLATHAHELRIPLAPALLGLQEMEQNERFVDAAPTLAMIRRNIEMPIADASGTVRFYNRGPE
jgi:signal transduction histidine kinase